MELMLQKKEILDLGSKLKGLEIICLDGRCWLTQTGDSHDHILRNGHRFNNRQDGQLLVIAIDDCRLKLLRQKNCFLPRINSPYFPKNKIKLR